MSGPGKVDGDVAVKRAAVVPWGDSAWAVVVQPGSDSKDLYDAMAQVPAGLRFVTAFGDVDVALVYDIDEARESRRDMARAMLRAAIAKAAGVDHAGLTGEEAGPRPVLRFATDGERAAYYAGRADGYAACHRALTPHEPTGADDTAPPPDRGS